MPLYQEWSPNPHSLAAIWHIEEPEAFFLNVDSVRNAVNVSRSIRHPRKRLEHLCGRYLLQHLKADFPLHHIAPDPHDKPRLPEDRYFFSISHSYPYVAAVISDKEECGIDIQVWKDRIADIAHMYLSETEQSLCRDSPSFEGNQLIAAKQWGEATLLTLAWSVKEAVYKWWGRRGVEFIEDLPIKQMLPNSTAFFPPSIPEAISIKMECFDHPLSPKALLYKDFALAYLVAHRPEDDK